MKRILILLFFITLLAALLRFLNLSPFTIYPDSYQNLLVAENIAVYHSVLGFLGPGGMLYPDFFMWTRPVYALLINGLNFFIHDSFLTARIIAYFLGVLSIPLAYFVYKTIFPEPGRRGSILGLAGAVLLALSYNHTIWSGLVMTESSGVFFMLLFLWSFFARVKAKTEYFNFKDLLCGILFAVAVLARYEYIIILLPVIYLIYTLNPRPYPLITNIVGSLLFSLGAVAFTLFPWQSVIPVIFEQLFELLIRAGVIVLIFAAGFLVFRFLSKKQKALLTKILPKVILVCLVLFSIFAVVSGQLPFFTNFTRHDILISIFTLIGIFMMIRNTTLRHLAYFSLIAIISLLFIYHRINPNMERYLTHIIPFLLIPASYGLVTSLRGILKDDEAIPHSKRLPRLLRSLAMTVIFVFLLLQILITAQGLSSLNDPSWYRTSYEEKVAKNIKPGNDSILLTSMPEPYYYRLRQTTHSITDAPPYLYIPDSLNDRTVIIIQDMGMRDVFPHFNKILETKLQKYKKNAFKVNETYHVANKSIPENEPVVVYEIKLGELRKLLK